MRKGNHNNNDFSFGEFFQSIYNNLLNLIQKNPQKNNNELIKKFNESFNDYYSNYRIKINFHVDEPSTAKIGLINLLNDCYIVTFLQILFHTPNFLKNLKELNSKKEKEIINYLIKVSEYPFNEKYFCELKQLFGLINPNYAKPWPNDSQEFGVSLIGYLISGNEDHLYEDDEQIYNFNEENNFIIEKKMAFQKYISTYYKKVNEIEKLFLFHQINIIYRENSHKTNISSNLHLELTLRKFMNYITIENLIDAKYNSQFDNINPKLNQIITKRKMISLPEILIITINRVLLNQDINNTKIIFNNILDLRNYIDYDLFNVHNKKTIYHLYAINECVHTHSSSHYICHIKLENKWFLFDDDKKVEEESNLGFKGLESSFVVGLFYIREI